MRIFKTFLSVFLTILASSPSYGGDFIPRTDKMVLGVPGSSANKVIEFNMGAGNPKPQIRANKTTQKLQFTNDGTVYKDIGSGSGGGGGIQLLSNGDFESGASNGWVNSGGTFTERNYSNIPDQPYVLNGNKSITFQATAAGQYFESELTTVPKILGGKTCHAKIYYFGDATSYKAEVLDDTNAVVWSGNAVLPALGNYSTYADYSLIPYTCGATGTKQKLRITSLSAASWGLVAFDDGTLGQILVDGNVDQSKAEFVGSVTISGCVSPFSTSSTTFANFAAVTGCTYTTTGEIAAPSTIIPGFKINSTKRGTYSFRGTGTFGEGPSAVGVFRISDGTVSSAAAASYDAVSASRSGSGAYEGVFENYQPSPATTIQFQGSVPGGGGSAYIGMDVTSLYIAVYRFPNASDPKRVLLSGENAMYAGEAFIAPAGVCLGDSVPMDGRAYKRADYPDLFSNVGTIYGDGTTQRGGPSGYAAGQAFNVADMGGQVPRGVINIPAVTGTGTPSSNNATFTGHGLRTGMRIAMLSGALSGITANTAYYAIAIDANTLAFATTRANSYAGTKIAISGTNTAVIQQWEDPDASSRTAGIVGGATGAKVGSEQEDAIQNITGTFAQGGNPAATGAFANGGSFAGVGQNSQPNYTADFNASRVVRASNETRMNNIAFQWCVRTKTGRVGMVINNGVISKDNPDTTVINTIKSVTTNYTASVNEETILADTTTAAFNVTLPSAPSFKGKKFIVKKTNAGPYFVTVNTTASQTIDGASTYVLFVKNESVEVQSDGANWAIVRQYKPAISVNYWASANVSSTTTQPINFDSQETDSANNGSNLVTTGSGWKFTAPAAVSCNVGGFVAGISTGTLILYKNGTAYKTVGQGTAGYGESMPNVDIRLNPGDYIDLRTSASSTITGGSLSVASNISIKCVGF